MNKIVSLFCGIIFGIGLVVSEMINPAKVLGFLNIFDAWDPSLAFVMIGALVVSTPLFHLFKILSEAEEIHIMESSIRCLIEDPRLVLKSKPNYYDIRGHLWLKPHTTRWDWNIIRGNERWSIDSVKNSIQ